MSNIFQPYTRGGILPLSFGSGPPTDPIESQHLLLNDAGEIYCVRDGTIAYYGAAVPFDINGRMVVSEAEVVKWDQGIPFTAADAVAVREFEERYFDQSLPFAPTGHITYNREPQNIGEYFEYFTSEVTNLAYDLDQIGLVPDTGDYCMQMVYYLKPGFDTVLNQDLTQLRQVGSSDGGRIATPAAPGSLRVRMTDSVETTQVNSHNYVKVAGDYIDVRWRFDKTTGLTSWVDQVDRQDINNWQEFTNEIERWLVKVSNSDEWRLVAARLVQGACTDGDILGWPTYTLPLPDWSVIPDQQNYQYQLPDTLDAAAYVTSSAGPLTNWSLVAPPVGFSISASGIITAGPGVPVATNVITVRVENDAGSEDSAPFNWVIEVGDAPSWATIPEKKVVESNLPDIYDVSSYVTEGDAPITAYSLVSPPVGFSISNAGVITAADTLSVGAYPITVRATNAIGDGDSAPFNYEVLYDPIAPIWDPIPDQSDQTGDLPVVLDVSVYASVRDNSPPITSFSLVSPPSGFTISVAGVITVAGGTAPSIYSISVNATNSIGTSSDTFQWSIVDAFEPPIWGTIPDRNDLESELPLTYDVTPYVTTNNGALTGWALISPPAGFTIDGTGTITAAASVTEASHSLTVEVSNLSGTTQSAPFTWTITDDLFPPVWSTVPNRADEEQTLPLTYDMKPYVTSNSGPLTGWTLAPPPAGFSIDSTGVITAADGLSLGTRNLTVRVSNDEGTSDSATFTWEIEAERTGPVWTTIPPQFTRENLLPAILDTTPYVTASQGALTGWTLIAPPAGFTIDGSGTITVAFGTAVANYAITVEVSDERGTVQSDSFIWEIAEELLPPQWGTVPDQSDRENELPQSIFLDMYVTSNSGPLVNYTLVLNPGGFTIVPSTGQVTAQSGLAVGNYTLQAEVTNDEGTTQSNTWSWDILEELLPPQWSTIPDREDDVEDLPVTYNVAGFVTTNSGPLTGWQLLSPPAGFTINSSGVINAAAGIEGGDYNIQVRVSNDTGTADSAIFVWTIVAVDPNTYLHEYNGTMGAHSFERSTAASILNGNTLITVGVDEPVFAGLSYSGGWVPDSNNFLGFAAQRTCTQDIRYSTDLTNGVWTKSNVNVTATTASPTSSGGYVRQVGATTAFFGTGASGWAYESSATVDADIVGSDTTTGGTPLSGLTGTAQIYGNSQSYSGTSAVTWLFNTNSGTLAIPGTVLSPIYTYPADIIVTQGSTSTRNTVQADATLADLGFANGDFDTDSCGQMKVYMPDTSGDSGAPGQFVAEVMQFSNDITDIASGSGIPSNYWGILYFDGDWEFYQVSGGSRTVLVSATVAHSRGDLVDVRWSRGNGLASKLWIDNVEYTGSVASNITLPTPTYHHLGYGWNSVTEDSANARDVIVRMLRLVSDRRSDAEIEGWA